MGLWRKEPKNQPVRVADLDRIRVRSAVFRLHGIDRVIRPISAVQFFEYSKRLAELIELREKNLDDKAYVTAFYNVFSEIVTPLSLGDVERCTLQQQAAFFAVVSDCITGREERITGDAEKKN